MTEQDNERPGGLSSLRDEAVPSSPKASIPDAGWLPYSEHPKTEGAFRWKVPHKFLDGLVVSFVACMRKRGAGYTDVISPSFDHWDGWKVTVPNGLMWQEYDGPEIKRYEQIDPSYIGYNAAPCPFCKQVPKLNYSGRFIGAAPCDSEYWYLSCCKWASNFANRYRDPRQLVSERAKAIEAGTAETGTGSVHESAVRQDLPKGSPQ